MSSESDTNVQEETKIKEKTRSKKRVKIEPPQNFRVVLHNNDVTHFDAVVNVLAEVFCNGSRTKANLIMWHAHHTGIAQCLVAPKGVCDGKVIEANECKMKWHAMEFDKHYDQLVFETQPMPSEE